MASEKRFYDAAMFVWAVVVGGGSVAVAFGFTEPYLSASQIPGDPGQIFAGGVVAVVLGALVVQVLKVRSWRAAGREAGLSSGFALLRSPDVTGTVGGRPVRAYTHSVRKGGSGESGGRSVTYTNVEAELDGPADVGVVVTPAAGPSGGSPLDVDLDEAQTAVSDDRLAAIGPEDAAEAVISGRARQTLLDLDEPGLVFVGDGADALVDALPDTGGSMMGSLFETAIRKGVPGDASTVTTTDKGLEMDGDALRRRVEAVAAVADAFEGATDTSGATTDTSGATTDASEAATSGD